MGRFVEPGKRNDRFVKPFPPGTKLPWYKNNPWVVAVIVGVAVLLIWLGI